MAWNIGTGGFTAGTGTETINLGMTGITNLDIWYPSSTNKPSEAHIAGGSVYSIPDRASSTIVNKFQILNTSGTVIFEATYTGTSGSSVLFNKTINTLGTFTCLFKFGNV